MLGGALRTLGFIIIGMVPGGGGSLGGMPVGGRIRRGGGIPGEWKMRINFNYCFLYF